MPPTIHPANPDQASALTRIAVAAKAHWGYPPEKLARWERAFLTITPTYIEANRVWVARVDATPVGFAAVTQPGDDPILDHLWILPTWMGQGLGKRLFAQAAASVPHLLFTADPHADGFYRKLGAQTIGTVYSTLQETMLTQFRYPPLPLPGSPCPRDPAA